MRRCLTKEDLSLLAHVRNDWLDGLDVDVCLKTLLTRKDFAAVKALCHRPQRKYAPRKVLSVDKTILEMFTAKSSFTREQIINGVMRRGKNVQARSVYLRLLALVKAGKVVKQGNAKQARYLLP